MAISSTWIGTAPHLMSLILPPVNEELSAPRTRTNNLFLLLLNTFQGLSFASTFL